MLLTLDEYRGLNPEATSLEDESLQLLLDAAEAEITRAAGPVGSVTEFLAGGRTVTLSRRASSVTSVTETDHFTHAETILSADDYVAWPGGYVIERQSGGTNSRYRWHDRVTVEYVPADDVDIRKVVQSDLVNLMESFAPGLTSETVGAWSRTLASNSVWNQLEEREAILARLVERGRMLVV